MNHTFLFQEGLWVASGFYMDENHRFIPLGGEARIIHQEDLWLNQSDMRVRLEEPIEFQSNYEIVPFTPDRDCTTWQSLNPALGKLLGKYVVVDDSILSFFHSADGRLTGTEYWLKVDDVTYKNRGVLFEGDRRGSSWIAELRRVR